MMDHCNSRTFDRAIATGSSRDHYPKEEAHASRQTPKERGLRTLVLAFLRPRRIRAQSSLIC